MARTSPPGTISRCATPTARSTLSAVRSLLASPGGLLRLCALSCTLRARSACVLVQSQAARICLLAAHRLCQPCAMCQGGSRGVRVRCVWRPAARSCGRKRGRPPQGLCPFVKRKDLEGLGPDALMCRPRDPQGHPRQAGGCDGALQRPPGRPPACTPRTTSAGTHMQRVPAFRALVNA
jgi:hypothetical protein